MGNIGDKRSDKVALLGYRDTYPTSVTFFVFVDLFYITDNNRGLQSYFYHTLAPMLLLEEPERALLLIYMRAQPTRRHDNTILNTRQHTHIITIPVPLR